eukprot:1527871-Prymnesium_polylepis.1
MARYAQNGSPCPWYVVVRSWRDTLKMDLMSLVCSGAFMARYDSQVPVTVQRNSPVAGVCDSTCELCTCVWHAFGRCIH